MASIGFRNLQQILRSSRGACPRKILGRKGSLTPIPAYYVPATAPTNPNSSALSPMTQVMYSSTPEIKVRIDALTTMKVLRDDAGFSQIQAEKLSEIFGSCIQDSIGQIASKLDKIDRVAKEVRELNEKMWALKAGFRTAVALISLGAFGVNVYQYFSDSSGLERFHRWFGDSDGGKPSV